jgi:hypothetical protein
MRIITKVAMASVLALVLLGGLNVRYDFPKLSMFGASGRASVHVHDLADASRPVFFVTRYMSHDPGRFDIVLMNGGPAARDYSRMSAEIRGEGRRELMTVLCPRSQEYCQPVMTARIGDGAVATVIVIDYDASGAVIGRSTDRFELRRRWEVSLRFWDTMMSA